jgi:hypothetical protein
VIYEALPVAIESDAILPQEQIAIPEGRMMRFALERRLYW